MASQLTTDVIICGAGAAGLTLAIELARRGVSFQLVEKLATPFPGSRGKGIQPRTQEVFEDLGILDKVVARGGIYPRQRAYREDGSYVESDLAQPADASPAEPYQRPVMLPQFLTEQIMRERLNELGCQVQFGCELLGFEQDADGITAILSVASGRQAVRARYLVGADGGRSFVRKTLGVDFPGKTLNVRAIVADVTLTGLEGDAWHLFNDADMQRMVAICPLAGTDLFQIQAPISPDQPTDLSEKGLTQWLAHRTGRDTIVVHAVSWASDYQMSARLAQRYRVDRVFLVGDAAHVHPPTGGQGLNTSVQDAYNLGWKLAAVLRGAHDSLLDSYETERRPVAQAVLGLSTRLLGDQKQGGVRRGRETRQLDLGYTDSPLATELPRRKSGIRAGARAPDAVICGAAGQPSRLFQLFKGVHWTLLAHAGRPETPVSRPGLQVHYIGAKGDIIDVRGHIRDAYGLEPGECALIRPDGYVGAIVDADGAAGLGDYLDRVGLG
ncbi:2-polyprenyl-6-methoxyphenol hydroxylase [Advenella sp. S44]|uniref:FAD-dependent oxidoreductase n=1 Tax=Advenella sp. S44 TaxID=1982755 RepID=UPI000C2A1ACB|nr:FAD-dependent oxidoreductase [Advenella sp. S44]PJX26114.1 2-polyprenyl-6-methoxyphenol hydroxylase [Advenella sp. S44]